MGAHRDAVRRSERLVMGAKPKGETAQGNGIQAELEHLGMLISKANRELQDTLRL